MSNNFGTRASRRERVHEEPADSKLAASESSSSEQVPATEPKMPERHTRVTHSAHEKRKDSSNTSDTSGIRAVFDRFFLAIVSFILSLGFASFPVWSNLATSGQSQYLYSGFAMRHGIVPFNGFYGTGGALFYMLNSFGNLTGSRLILYLISLVALYLSGVLVYRLISRRTGSQWAGQLVAIFTLITIAAISRGGDTPTVFAMPFVLWSVNFLDRYFQKVTKRDEAFILYGMAGAATLVISPVMFIFWIVSGLALVVHHIKERSIGRGIYQFLAAIFGLLLLGYAVAYYALNTQILYSSIEQSILIPLGQLGLAANFAVNLAKTVVFVLVFGFVTMFANGVAQLKRSANERIWSVALLIGAGLVFLLVLFSKNFDSTNLLALLPFVIAFVGQGLQTQDEHERDFFWRYLRMNLFMPVLALLFVIGLPLSSLVLDHGIFTEEKAVAQLVKAHTSSQDKLFVLSPDKNINLLAQRVSDLDLVPNYYPIKFSQNFDLQVATLGDKYVVLEAGQTVSAPLKNLLNENYKLIRLDNVSHFAVYQLK